MLTSKEILDRTGISRATLNNYISLGLLSKPMIANPGIADGPRQLGYFPDDAIERVLQVQKLKQQGVSMNEIVSNLGRQVSEVQAPAAPRADVVALATVAD